MAIADDPDRTSGFDHRRGVGIKNAFTVLFDADHQPIGLFPNALAGIVL